MCTQDARVLPVFIWAMRGQSHEPILFTDNRQAVAYPDMVMAVSDSVCVCVCVCVWRVCSVMQCDLTEVLT